MTYRPDGLILKNNNNYYAWQGDNIIYEFGTYYTRGLGLIKASTGLYYLQNGHGDISALAKENGTVSTRYMYDAFGNSNYTGEYSDNLFKYCGEYEDSSLGGIYLRARIYNPGTGRFTAEDPARDGLNWYAYCHNDPVNFIDMNGYWDERVHYKKTKAMFTELGFNSYHAEIVASADNDTDYGSTGPYPWQDPSRHFDRNPNPNIDSREEHAEKCLTNAVNEWNFADFLYHEKAISKQERHNRRIKALETLGIGLHSLQDIDAHMDWATDDFEGRIPAHSTKDEEWIWEYYNSKFDDPRYDIQKDSNGDYIAKDSGKEYGSKRYNNTIIRSKKYLKQFYNAIDGKR